MANEDRLAESLRELAHFSVVESSMTETLHRIAVLANETVPGSAMVGLTMAVHGRPGTPVFTDEAAPEIDSTQYETGRGPCIDSFRTGVVNTIASTLEDERWPEFCETCRAHGMSSTLSVPVQSRGTTFGALNFYSAQPANFDAGAIDLATAFAAQAAVVISNVGAYWSARQVGEQLTEALASRVVIEQAKGLLMATGITSDAAFDLLRNASQRQNRKLHDIAAEIVERAEKRAKSE